MSRHRAAAVGVDSVRTPSQAAPAATPISFNRDIRPILANNCFACHGPDEKHRETKFHFDTEDGAFAKRGVIVPGKPADSLLVQRITNPDPDEHMPPPDSGHALTDKQIDLLRRWIDEGRQVGHALGLRPAEARRAAGRQPAANGCAIRSISSSSRGSTAKVCSRRRSRQGHAAPPRDATTSRACRRRPRRSTRSSPTSRPTPTRKRVDALLHSPHYGERMAVPWLDAARYADTHGYHIDSLREHVAVARLGDRRLQPRTCRSIEFTIEQLAGDLLPNATRDQKIASGFNRNHMINFEGGAIAEEYQVEYVVDRVEATSSTFMGLTMGCARCHSHKYDPITHKEFYQFFAFFNSVPEEGLDGRRATPSRCCRCRPPRSRRSSTSPTAAIDSQKGGADRRHRRTVAARVGEDDLGHACPTIDTTG